MPKIGFELNAALELLDNFLRDDESKTYATCVHVSGVADEAKELEKLDLVLFFDADASVHDFHKKKAINDVHPDLNAALLRELNSIRLQVEQHLHDPLFVGHQNGAVYLVCIARVFIFVDVSKGSI